MLISRYDYWLWVRKKGSQLRYNVTSVTFGRGRRHPQSLICALSQAVITSRNSQHLSLRFGIIQIAGTDARRTGAVAPALGIIGQTSRHPGPQSRAPRSPLPSNETLGPGLYVRIDA
jgi:hypothetical protein